ncbi:MAG: TraR/DksA C4-type zinc finger protein [Deltaproteobacteria bacterium]|nr:TraR/DksA C4-type zinc finger protein [Deltaproteobacteria bacterium]MCB9787181.1 TraR/DksA C4-type zinc finger protein [Deltaproteobacteria bacterium]
MTDLTPDGVEAQRLEIEAQLSEQLETLELRLARIHAHQKNAGREVSRDWDDRASERQNDEVVEALLPHTLAEIAAIRRALERLQGGDALTCERCDGPISPKRLAIVPETRFCAECAG